MLLAEDVRGMGTRQKELEIPEETAEKENEEIRRREDEQRKRRGGRGGPEATGEAEERAANRQILAALFPAALRVLQRSLLAGLQSRGFRSPLSLLVNRKVRLYVA